jgi:hypothetical protein
MPSPARRTRALVLTALAAASPTLAAACAGAAPDPPSAAPATLTLPPPSPLSASAAPTLPAPPAAPAPASRCSTACTGSAPLALQEALRAAARAGVECYKRTLRTRDVIGRIVVSIKVSESGELCEAGVLHDELGSSDITSCVLTLFRKAPLTPAAGGCVIVNIPISFAIKDDGPPADAGAGG